ncbi:MlaD family protein [Xylanibacter brevis]|uniref:MlaD family protein n=1 Tax=Xylanibacter brevis TaxID=83231 RepID=UPI0004896C8C|nr:MlaD family protein [Xylanibacter brevis]
MKYLTKEVKIGLMAVVSIIVLFAGMQFLKGLNLFNKGNEYYAKFDNVSGLSASSPIYANGFKVGVVKKIIYDYNNPKNILALVELNKKLQLPVGTTAAISSDLLGNVKMELRFGKNPVELMETGDTIKGEIARGSMDKAADMLPQLEAMIPKVDSILMSLNKLLADPALASILHNVDGVTANLTTTTSELNTLTASLNKQMPQMLKKADGVLANTEGFTRQLNEMDLAATMNKVNATMDNLQQTTDKMNSKEGTLGLLLNDRALYNNLNATMYHADSLMMDLRLHPKRYVHFSVFGRKGN